MESMFFYSPPESGDAHRIGPTDLFLLGYSCIPYKYALERFINTAVVDRDQSDPSVYTVLTAKSKIPGVAITEVMAFTPKWNATTNSFRPPVSPHWHQRWCLRTQTIGCTSPAENKMIAEIDVLVLSSQHGCRGHGHYSRALRWEQPRSPRRWA
jgi:hypothetical protein